MKYLEADIKTLEDNIVEMWTIVIKQLNKAQISLKNFDKTIAYNVQENNKILNSLELKIEKNCESILLLNPPINLDIKFVLIVLKLNNNLDRVGDCAFNISKIIENQEYPFSEKLLKSCKVFEMFEICVNLLTDTLNTFSYENKELLKNIFEKEEIIKKINKEASEKVANYINNNKDEVNMAINIISIIRKLERSCDQIQNIAEEMVFYLHAKKVNISKN
jgi:phosphate transport system protein